MEDAAAKFFFLRSANGWMPGVSQGAHMSVMFVRHEVADYDVWKKAYDEAADFQKASGVKAEAVYRHEDNPNVVTVYHKFDTIDAARAMANDPALKEVMDKIGVRGKPEIWFAQEV